MSRLSRKLWNAVARSVAFAARKFPDRAHVELKSRLQRVQRMDYAGSPISLHVDSLIELKLRLKSCAKEPDTVEWIEDSLESGDVLYDVGANVGAYSLIAAKHGQGKVQVIAFEPAFQNFAQLCRNIRLNGCDDLIAALPLALSDETRLDHLHYRTETVGSAQHALREALDEMGKPFEAEFRQAVVSYRIDDAIRQLSLPPPTHIKIDVDGLELAVLQGAQETLALPCVRSLNLELEDGDREREVTALLAKNGFTLGSKHPRWTPGVSNCIFVRVESS